MSSIVTELKLLRQQLEKLQVEVSGRQSLGSMVVWDEQNESSVNSATSYLREDFNGLIVHLTPDLSPPLGTNSTGGISQTDFNALKADIVDALVGSAG